MKCMIAKLLADDVVLLTSKGEFRTVPVSFVLHHLPVEALAAGIQIELPWPPPDAAANTQQAPEEVQAPAKASWWTRLAWQGWTARLGSVAVAAALVVALWPRVMPALGQSVVAIDINPSLELTVDAAGRVTGATPLNDDARRVLDGLSLKGEGLPAATDAVIARVIALGYLGQGKDNVILAAVVPGRGQTGPDPATLQKQLAAQLQSAGLSGYVSVQRVSSDIRRTGQRDGLSVNKELARQRLAKEGAAGAPAPKALESESVKDALKAAGLDVTSVFPGGVQLGSESDGEQTDGQRIDAQQTDGQQSDGQQTQSGDGGTGKSKEGSADSEGKDATGTTEKSGEKSGTVEKTESPEGSSKEGTSSTEGTDGKSTETSTEAHDD